MYNNISQSISRHNNSPCVPSVGHTLLSGTFWAFAVHAPGGSVFLIIFRKDKIIILLSYTRTIPIILWQCDGCWSSRNAVCYWKMLSCHLLLTSSSCLSGKQPIIQLHISSRHQMPMNLFVWTRNGLQWHLCYYFVFPLSNSVGGHRESDCCSQT